MIDASSASIIAATAAALFLKGLVLSYVQVAARYRARSFSRPEDARLLGLARKANRIWLFALPALCATKARTRRIFWLWQ